MKRQIFFTSCAGVFLALITALPSPAQKKKNIFDIKESITDNNIVYPEANYEAESRKMLEGWYMQNYMATDDRYMSREDVPTTDQTYRTRLSELPTIIEMPYNQVVKSHIERYTKKGRPMVASLLGLSNYYMPIFEQALEEAGLPLELKYLPVIESALDPNAVSKAGATGLWQFMLIAAKGLDMEVNSLVDERRDPYISSRKAAKFLKDLYNTYGDWSLAIAAYNCGPGNVNKALRRAGTDPSNLDYWAIYNYLPAETRGYVPAFIAANYVMTHYKDHNISPVIPKRPLVTDTLHINKRVHFNQISKVLNIPVEELRMLNPQFRADIIPGNASKSYNLILPSQQIHAYLMSEEDILTFESEKYARRMDAEPGKIAGEAEVTETMMAMTDNDGSSIYDEMSQAPTRKEEAPAEKTVQKQESNDDNSKTLGPSDSRTKTHKVQPGESLASIAAKYGVGPEDIKSWNNLRRNSVRTGQVLRIADTSAASASNTDTTPAPRKSENAVHKSETADNQASTAKSTGGQYRNKATASEEQTSNQKRVKANTKEAQATAKKGAASETKDTRKRGKKGATASSSTQEHVVSSGETYERIARKYGVTTEELKKANNATSDMIRPDQKLKIPKKSSSTTKSTSKGTSKGASTTSKKKGSKRRK